MRVAVKAVVGYSAAAVVAAALLTQCDNGAVGVDACRQIEGARCEAVLGCPNSPVQEDDDVAQCKLFYRDQCLHGVADGLNPDDVAITACLAALQAARACWDAGLNLGDCNTAAVEAGTDPIRLSEGTDPAGTGCDAIMVPEIMYHCSWLVGAEPSEGGAGGSTGGAGGSTGGANAGGSTGGAAGNPG